MQARQDPFSIVFTDGKRISLPKLKNQIDRNFLKITLLTQKLFPSQSVSKLNESSLGHRKTLSHLSVSSLRSSLSGHVGQLSLYGSPLSKYSTTKDSQKSLHKIGQLRIQQRKEMRQSDLRQNHHKQLTTEQNQEEKPQLALVPKNDLRQSVELPELLLIKKESSHHSKPCADKENKETEVHSRGPSTERRFCRKKLQKSKNIGVKQRVQPQEDSICSFRALKTLKGKVSRELASKTVVEKFVREKDR